MRVWVEILIKRGEALLFVICLNLRGLIFHPNDNKDGEGEDEHEHSGEVKPDFSSARTGCCKGFGDVESH